MVQVFDSLDKDGSGYVEENDWRRLTEDTPLAASDDTFLFIERVHYLVLYPFQYGIPSLRHILAPPQRFVGRFLQHS